MSPHIRIGLIGTGNIGRTHLEGFRSLREAGLLDIEIAALCDADPGSLSNAASQFQPARTYDDYKDLIHDADVDVVYICTPTNLHSDIVKAAADAGKPMLCEKPLAHSCPQARDLMAVTQRAGVSTSVGLILRYDPFVLYAKDLIESRDFGRPLLAHIRDDQQYPAEYAHPAEDESVLMIGGGTLLENGIHGIDLLLWLFGDIESIYAKTVKHTGAEFEDIASVVMTHNNGMVSTLDSIWHSVDRPSERRIEFFFERGHIGITLESGDRYLEYHLQGEGQMRVSDDNANLVLLKNLGLENAELSLGAHRILTSPGAERYAALSYSFLNALQSGTQSSPDFRDAVAAHKIVDAAYESASTGRVITPL